jgi:hypothetical protein
MCDKCDINIKIDNDQFNKCECNTLCCEECYKECYVCEELFNYCCKGEKNKNKLKMLGLKKLICNKEECENKLDEEIKFEYFYYKQKLNNLLFEN